LGIDALLVVLLLFVAVTIAVAAIIGHGTRKADDGSSLPFPEKGRGPMRNYGANATRV
jgi:hypothetical protein